MLHRIVSDFPVLFTASNMLFLLQAMGVTLALALAGCGIGTVFGLLLAYVRQSQSPWLLPVRLVAIAYVEVFRRIPFLVILFIVLFAVQALNPNFSLFSIAVVAICLLSTAFISEIFRAGFESVPRQQIEAATVLNFTRAQTLAFVILPQAWKIILPSIVIYAVMFIKDTSLAGQIGVIELTYAGKSFDSRGISATLAFGAIMVCYFALSYPLAILGAWLEAKLGSTRHPKPERELRQDPSPA